MGIVAVGEKLRATRKSKGITIGEAVEKTYIQAKFIVALECNDYKVFPAEAYVRGFLKIYSEFLGLDPVEMSSLYKATKNTAVVPEYEEKEYCLADDLELGKEPKPVIVTPPQTYNEPDCSKLITPKTVVAKTRETKKTKVTKAQVEIFEAVAEEKPVTQNKAESIQPEKAGPAVRENSNSEYTVASLADFTEGNNPQEKRDKFRVEIPTPENNRPTAVELEQSERPTPSLKQRMVQERSQKTFINNKLAILLVVFLAVVGAWFILGRDGDTPVPQSQFGGVFAKKQQQSSVQAEYIELSGAIKSRCWAQITADGKEIYEGVMEPGHKFNWQAKNKLHVHIGHAGALVDLKLNQKPFSFGGEPNGVIFQELTLKDVK